MARISGAVINVGLGKEVTPGTAVAPGYWVPDLDLQFDDKIKKVLNESRFGTIEKNQNGHIMTQWAEGSLKGVIYRNFFGLILAALFGATSTDSTVDTSAKKHVFALANNNQHLSLTLAKKDPNLDVRMVMARIDSLKIDYVVNDYVKFEAGFVSKKSATAADTVSYASDIEFIPKAAVIKTAATGVSNLGAATALTNIKSISIEVKKNIKQTQGLGSVDLENLVNTDFEVSGTIERYYDDTTFKDFVFNNTHRSVRLDLIDVDSGLIGSATQYGQLTLDMDEVIFTDWSESMTDGDVVTEKIGFTAVRNFSAANTLTATLYNLIASY